MIRVNLLEKEGLAAVAAPERVSSKKSSTPGLLVLAGALALVGLHYLYLMHQTSSLQDQLTAQQATAARLAIVKQQYQLELQRRQQLLGRIAIIQQLRRRRSGPYQLMARVGHSVEISPAIWLTSFQQNGRNLDFSGRALDLRAVAGFITALRTSGDFSRVRLASAVEISTGGQHVMRSVHGPAGMEQRRNYPADYHFKLTAQFTSLPPAAAPPAQGRS